MSATRLSLEALISRTDGSVKAAEGRAGEHIATQHAVDPAWWPPSVPSGSAAFTTVPADACIGRCACAAGSLSSAWPAHGSAASAVVACSWSRDAPCTATGATYATTATHANRARRNRRQPIMMGKLISPDRVRKTAHIRANVASLRTRPIACAGSGSDINKLAAIVGAVHGWRNRGQLTTSEGAAQARHPQGCTGRWSPRTTGRRTEPNRRRSGGRMPSR